MSSAPDRPLAERIARGERIVVIASIALVAALAWGWIATGAGMHDMGAMETMPGMAGMASTGTAEVAVVLLMWWLMMAAMMLPSAAPAILLYGTVRRQRGAGGVVASSWLFLAGYLLAWLAVSVLATGLQLGATRAGLLDAMTLSATSPLLAGATLIAAGLYQWSPAKHACLVQCRSPAAFLARHWQAGPQGAVRLGLLHGGYCVGCCWLLMALLFVGGVMNFRWIAALGALVAVEKLLPRATFTARAAGVVLILWGAARIAA